MNVRFVPTHTEAEIAADAVCALLVAKLVLPGDAQAACEAVGVSLVDLNNARLRRHNGRYRPPGHGDVLPTIKYDPPPAPASKQAPEPAEPNPPEPYADRFCTVCTYWKPESGFVGTTCRECNNRIRRSRYLSVETEKACELATLRYLAAHGDPLLRCSTCGEFFRDDDEVVARGVAMHHASHEADTQP